MMIGLILGLYRGTLPRVIRAILSGNVKMRFNDTLAHPYSNQPYRVTLYTHTALHYRSCSVRYLRDHSELSAEIDMIEPTSGKTLCQIFLLFISLLVPAD